MELFRNFRFSQRVFKDESLNQVEIKNAIPVLNDRPVKLNHRCETERIEADVNISVADRQKHYNKLIMTQENW